MSVTFQFSSEMEESSPSTTSALNVSRGVKTATFYGWKYNHYFVVVEEGEKNLRVRCTLCAPSQKHCRVLVTQRLTLRSILTPFTRLRNWWERSQRKKLKSDREMVLKMTMGLRSKAIMHANKPAISPMKLRNLMSEYIVEDMLPLSTADSPAFRKLIGGVYSTQIPDRKALTLHLDKLFVSMEPKLKGI